MSNPTTPFNWQMPTATDLVTDLPADFEVFGQAVATSMGDLLGGTTGQVLAKATNTDMDFNWVTPELGDITAVNAGTGISGGGTTGAVTVTNSMATAITTNGDIIYGTGSGTFSRLGIGSTGQVLKVAAGIPSWAAASAVKSFALISTTNLTGATSITITGLSGYDRFNIVIFDAGSVNAVAGLSLQFNSDTGSNYQRAGFSFVGSTHGQTAGTSTSFPLASTGSSAAADVDMTIQIWGANTSGVKPVQIIGAGTDDQSYFYGGNYLGTGVISSMTLISASGNFDEGTVYIYGAA
jgi:hypothetical protein